MDAELAWEETRRDGSTTVSGALRLTGCWSLSLSAGLPVAWESSSASRLRFLSFFFFFLSAVADCSGALEDEAGAADGGWESFVLAFPLEANMSSISDMCAS